MNTSILWSAIFFFFAWSNAIGQQKTEVSSKFVPKTVTYNASPNPNECWEAVDWGINIDTKIVRGFFNLPNKAVKTLKEKIGDDEVLIEVIYYEEPVEGSRAIGSVSKITFKGEVIYENK